MTAIGYSVKNKRKISEEIIALLEDFSLTGITAHYKKITPDAIIYNRYKYGNLNKQDILAITEYIIDILVDNAIGKGVI